MGEFWFQPSEKADVINEIYNKLNHNNGNHLIGFDDESQIQIGQIHQANEKKKPNFTELW